MSHGHFSLLAAKPNVMDDDWWSSLFVCLIFLALVILFRYGSQMAAQLVSWCRAKPGKAPPIVEKPFVLKDPIPESELLKNAEAERNTRQATMAMAGVDASFDTETLCRRAQNAFEKLQTAISEGRLQDVEAFMSDGVHERLLSDQAELSGMRRRMVITQVGVAKTELCEAAHEGSYEHAAVRISGAMLKTTVAMDDKSIPEGRPEKFSEIWTFLRQRGRMKSLKKGLMEGFCPSCGAPILMNQHTLCVHCKSLLRNGKFDWVLIEISQGEHWTRTRTGDAIGWDALLLRDPSFNIALLEDRASVMFERWLTAYRTGRIEPLKKIATDAFCDYTLKFLREGYWYRDCMVDAVRTRGIVPGKEFDKALIEICWDASLVRREDSPQAAPQRNLVSRQLMVLKRLKDVKSEIADGFGAAHCPHCGAPESLDPETACPHCGTSVNDGSLTWNLMDLVPMSGALAQQYLEQLRAVEMDSDAVACGRRKIGTSLASAPTRILQPRVVWRVELLAWAIELARADGEITSNERLALIELGLRMDIKLPRIELLLCATTLQLQAPQERGEMNLWLGELARLAMVDGAIAEKESDVLLRVAQRTGMNEADARMTISKARLKQYESSPVDLKAQWQKGRSSDA